MLNFFGRLSISLQMAQINEDCRSQRCRARILKKPFYEIQGHQWAPFIYCFLRRIDTLDPILTPTPVVIPFFFDNSINTRWSYQVPFPRDSPYLSKKKNKKEQNLNSAKFHFFGKRAFQILEKLRGNEIQRYLASSFSIATVKVGSKSDLTSQKFDG